MPHIPAGSTSVHDFDGVRFIGIAAPSRGAVESGVWRVTIPAGSVSRSTHQLSREEILVALAGTATARIGGESHAVASGDALIVPAFTEFSLDNPSAQPFEALVVLPVGGRALMADRQPFVPPWAR